MNMTCLWRKTNKQGYYEKIVKLIRSLSGTVLKTNENHFFVVLVECLHVAKEDIFTRLNNFYVFSIAEVELDGYFCFTDTEVQYICSTTRAKV